MSNTVTSQQVGQLRQDESISEWWVGEAIAIPLFDGKELNITFMDFEPDEDPDIKEADEALAYFFRLDGEVRKTLSPLVYKNCMNFLNNTGYNESDAALRQIKNED